MVLELLLKDLYLAVQEEVPTTAEMVLLHPLVDKDILVATEVKHLLTAAAAEALEQLVVILIVQLVAITLVILVVVVVLDYKLQLLQLQLHQE